MITRVVCLFCAFLFSWTLPETGFAQTPISPGAYAGTSENGTTLGLVLESNGDGFSLVINEDDREFQKSFIAGDEPNTFIGTDESLLSLFGGDDEPDPLAGDKMIWARVKDQSLAVYLMEIDDNGHFLLRQWTFSDQENGVLLDINEKKHQADLMRDRGLLTTQ